MSIILGLLLVALGVIIGVTLTVLGIRNLCLDGEYLLAKRIDVELEDGTETVTYRTVFNNHID